MIAMLVPPLSLPAPDTQNRRTTRQSWPVSPVAPSSPGGQAKAGARRREWALVPAPTPYGVDPSVMDWRSTHPRRELHIARWRHASTSAISGQARVDTVVQVRALVRLSAQRWASETGCETRHAWGQEAFMVRRWMASERLLWVLAVAYALVVLAL